MTCRDKLVIGLPDAISEALERLSMTFTTKGKRQDEISFLRKHGEI